MQPLKVIPILMLCTFIIGLSTENNGTRKEKVLEPKAKEDLAGVQITTGNIQLHLPSETNDQFRLDNLQPGKHQSSVDPGCLIEVDDSIDPGIGVRVDPEVDPDMIVKIPPESEIESKIVILKTDSLK